VTRAASLLLLVGLLVSTGVAGAEHEVYYRYTIVGYVKDARGAPLDGRTVTLTRDKTGLAYTARTGRDGLFVVVARLGDESAGETLTLRIDRLTHTVTARFDPGDHVAERGTRLDLLGSAFVERRSWFRSTLARFLETPAR
jgi:hypothetical protein